MSEGSYFVDHKRGEVMELRSHLRNAKIAKDDKQRREVIRKVIAYMTLGIDVSCLFSDMVMATNTRDLVQKKMVYLYLCTYASNKPDLTLLAVNTLQRDCRDDDPMIRGLALRSLCSLRVNNLVEYVMDPIRSGLTDGSSYVRKTAVMGVSKLFQMVPQMVKDSDLIDILYNMLKDKDSLVIINVIHSLNEILIDEGGMAINRKIIHHLLNKLHDFNEWGQITVLDLVSKYKPKEFNSNKQKAEQEVFDIMNLLEDRLRHSNSALVLSTTKVFLNLTSDMINVNNEVYKRIKTPILTLISNPNHAMAYPVVAHASLLVKKKPEIWCDSYKQFFCRYNDPLCVKELKVLILSDIVNDSNAFDIMNELAEYITDVHVEIARLSIQSIGKIAIKCESAFEEAIRLTISFLEMNANGGQDYIIAESCVSIKNMLRKYPSEFEEALYKLKSIMRNVEETEGICAVLWLLGEYGETFIEAPYILEEFINTYDEIDNSQIKLELLSSTMKLFFKKSPEMQEMLGKLLLKAINDNTKIDVRDRGAFYYRLLEYDVLKAEKIINCPKITIDSFADDNSNEKVINEIFNEFNTLSVIYKKPSAMFVNEEVPDLDDDEDDEDENDNENKNGSANNNNNNNEQNGNKSDVKENGNVSSPPQQQQAPPVQQQQQREEVKSDDAFGLDLLGLGGGGGNDNIGVNNVSSNDISLNGNVTCNSKTFQQLWKSLSVSESLTLSFSSVENAKNLPNVVNNASFKTMAKGTQKQNMKCYFYGQPAGTQELHFIECIINLTTLTAQVKFKGQSNEISRISQLFQKTIASIVT